MLAALCFFKRVTASKESDCTRRVIPRHDSHARRAVTREKSPADLAARWMISCRPYVNVRPLFIGSSWHSDVRYPLWCSFSFSLPALHFSRFASTPEGSFLPTLLRTVALPLPFSFSSPLSIFFSSRSSLSHASFFHWTDVSRLLSLLSLAP